MLQGLHDINAIPQATEFFNKTHRDDFEQRWGNLDNSQYLKRLFRFRTNPDGIFCVKTHFHQFADFEETIAAYHNNLVFIRIDRKDKLKQAISFFKGAITGRWSKSTEEEAERIPYSFDQILFHYKKILDDDQKWQDYFKKNTIAPYSLFYEELSDDYPSQIAAAGSFITGKSYDRDLVPPPSLKKQSDSISDYFYRRFMADMAKLKTMQKPLRR